MLDTLAAVYDKSEQLVGVRYSLFEGKRHFITAVELRLTSFAFHLRAKGDDTLSVDLGEVVPDPQEIPSDAGGNLDMWSSCIGGRIAWAWRLTNQQGYDDGLRLEINKSEEHLSTIVEFIVMASGIKIFKSFQLEAE